MSQVNDQLKNNTVTASQLSKSAYVTGRAKKYETPIPKDASVTIMNEVKSTSILNQ